MPDGEINGKIGYLGQLISSHFFRSCVMHDLVHLSLKRLLILAGISTCLACGTPDRHTPVAVQAAWVVLGEQGQAVARAITTDTFCPSMTQDGVTQRMQVRAIAATELQRKTAFKSEDSKPSAFPVMTCETVLTATTTSASIAGIPLPLPKAAPQKIVVIGDTGCRLQKSSAYFQGCHAASKWAFNEVAKTAASFKPDLVIHVGDYHYRENACPDGEPLCAGSAWGFGWDTWKADFFTPAAPLLAAAPWVVVRGNHESCTRAGQGWWRFMDPRALQAGRDCNREGDDVQGDYSAPYAVPLGRIGTEQAQLIIFDSSRVPYKVLAKTDIAYQIYMDQLKTVNQLAEHADVNFFINHHPLLGLGAEPQKDGSLKIFGGSLPLQDVMQTLNAKRLFPSKIQATISGHVHLFEAITFDTDHPAQFVSGNGGSSLSPLVPDPLPAGVTPFDGAHVAHFSNSDEVGFMTMERIANSWKIEAWNQHGKRIADCLMQDGKTVCSAR
jgi:Calcineurin-like phosphoesterase